MISVKITPKVLVLGRLAVWLELVTEWATADRSSRPEGRLVQVCR